LLLLFARHDVIEPHVPPKKEGYDDARRDQHFAEYADDT
jgi:hypothetical protein